MADPFAGAAAGTDPLAWLGLAIALVAATSFGLAQPIKLTLYAVILYVLLTNADQLAPAYTRFVRALRSSQAATARRDAGGSA